MISKDLFALSPEYQSNVRTSMKTWVIIIRLGDHGFEDHDPDHDDHDPDDCNQEEVQIPPCPPSPRGESSPACSCRACNKNQSGVSKTRPNLFALDSDICVSFVCVNARSILCRTDVASTLSAADHSQLTFKASWRRRQTKRRRRIVATKTFP